jgi:hypothetical protein
MESRARMALAFPAAFAASIAKVHPRRSLSGMSVICPTPI